MKASAILAVLLAAALAPLAALPKATVTYADGHVTLKTAAGAQRDLQIGDELKTGDSIRTGKDGRAEIDQGGATLRIAASTVFILAEREYQGQQRSVAQVALGSLKMRYDKLSGQEPLIKTAAAQAGVRGTELTVVSGEDGSSLIAVDKGLVDVSAADKTVSLAAGEGVEVPLGRAPGVKFTIDRSQTDYSKWNDDRLKSMLADPVAAMASIRAQLADYAARVADYDKTYKEYAAKLDAAQKRFTEILDKDGKDKALEFRNSTVDPLMGPTIYLAINERFEALAALSLRRFVAGRLQLALKPRLMAGKADWAAAYSASYDEFLADFEKQIVPVLVAPDI